MHATTAAPATIWVVLNIPCTRILAEPGGRFEWDTEEAAVTAATALGGFAYELTPAEARALRQ